MMGAMGSGGPVICIDGAAVRPRTGLPGSRCHSGSAKACDHIGCREGT